MERKTARLLSGWLIAGFVATLTGTSAGSGLVLAENTAVPAAEASPPATPNDTAPAATGAPAAPKSADAAGSLAVSAGPLEEARKILSSRIQQAKSEGIGISSYVMVFNSIEDAVKAGQTAEQIRPRVEQLARALKDQLDKGKILKTQRPTPAPASYAGGSSGGGAGGPGAGPGGGGYPSTPGAPPIPSGTDLGKIKEALAGGGGGNKDALIQKLKERFGGGGINNIPEAFRDHIPKDILDKLSN